ncbi:MAG: DUF4139 domain-containing protein [Treponema sp.]|jgi:hypothetical protein|nr:DUF4139 domain-containing protein [Treponema sp.]
MKNYLEFFPRIRGVLLLCASLILYPGLVSAQAIRDSQSPRRQESGQSPAQGAAQGAAQNAAGDAAQTGVREAELPLRRLALFSSGVGFFEHAGTVNGSAAGPVQFNLPFNISAVNDALKSLIINDPSPGSPTVRYASSEALNQALKSLRIDLSGNPGIGEILNALKGVELEVSAPSPLKGRIIGVEYRAKALTLTGEETFEAWLSLFTPQGIRVIAIKDIGSFTFKDENINADLGRALDLILASRDSETRNLLVNLPGEGSRIVSLSYVIPTPVWKASYRLDLSGREPFLQGWAIVDNDSDRDWNNVELSLVTGRPVSFIQNLYAPYRTARPVLPLAIAGVAESRTYDSGSGWAGSSAEPRAEEYGESRNSAFKSMADSEQMLAEKPMAAPAQSPRAAPAASPNLAGGLQSASGSQAGDQFEFTLRNPVNLDRRQSALLPLVEGSIKAEKTLVFSGSRALAGGSINPAISAELINTSGMKLPAGPITVYDGGIYAGDALIEFFPENEKRLISYGEDLSVSGSVSSANSRLLTGVTLSGGVMTISRRQSHEKVYLIRNASDESKKLIIEHPITSGATLAEPKNFDERTPNLYRFVSSLPGNGEIKFTVREETPLSERISLVQLRPESFLSYASSQEISANVRALLTRAIELRRLVDEAAQTQQELENQRSRLVSEQERIRRNLEAAGNQTAQGQEYLKRMVSMDAEIDALNGRINEANGNALAARKDYDNYIAGLNIN